MCCKQEQRVKKWSPLLNRWISCTKTTCSDSEPDRLRILRTFVWGKTSGFFFLSSKTQKFSSYVHIKKGGNDNVYSKNVDYNHQSGLIIHIVTYSGNSEVTTS